MALKANNVLIKSIDVGAKEWQTKTWSGLTNFSGTQIWTDGAHVYYSNGDDQYRLDQSTSTWEPTTWSGVILYGNYIWTDGENIYYSNGNEQYQLDKSTSTWSAKSWTGLTDCDGRHVWTDGETIYYSYGSQYQLDKSTSTWQRKTWSGFAPNYGSDIWTDGENIYYSSVGRYQYQLDKSTSTWQTKTWSGVNPWDGRYIWTDGANVYYSNGNEQYQLDKTTSTWLSKDWQGIVDLTSFNGMFMWQDTGGTIYFSYQEVQYELTPSIHYCYKGDACQWVKPYTITIQMSGTPYSGINVIIYRSSNAKGQEPSAVYDSSGGESSYVINVASTAADGQQIVGYYSDTLYVKAQSYSIGSDRYSINGQSYTVTGDGRLIVFVGHSVSCSSCHTSARTIRCNIRCSTSIAQIAFCSNTSADSSKCLN